MKQQERLSCAGFIQRGVIGFNQAYQFVFEPLALDVELHGGGAGAGAGTGAWTGATGAEVVAAAAAASAVGAAAVLRPADLIDGDTAKAPAAQGKPPAVIPSHDHCSHTRITVTGKKKEQTDKTKIIFFEYYQSQSSTFQQLFFYRTCSLNKQVDEAETGLKRPHHLVGASNSSQQLTTSLPP